MATPTLAKAETLRAAVYCRVSTDDQVKGASLSSQAQDCSARIEAEGWQPLGHYSDEGVSSSIPPTERPSFARLLSEGPDVIVLWALDRLARSELDWFTFRHEHPQVRVVTLDGVDTARGEPFMDGMRALWAAEEKRRIRERTMRGRLQRARTGHWVGGPAPYGRKVVPDPESPRGSLLALDEEETAVVRRAVHLLLKERLSTGQIAEALNAEGLYPRRYNPRGGERERRWSAQTVRRMLSDASLTGRFEWGQDRLPLRGPEVLDAQTFTRVQTALSSSARGPYNAARCYPLSGRLIRDNYGFAGWSHRGYYRYRPKGVSLKEGPTIPAEEVETRVWQAVCDFLLDKEKLLSLLPSEDGGDILSGQQIDAMRKRVEALEASKTEAFLRGVKLGLPDEEIMRAQETIGSEIEQARAHLEALERWSERSEENETRKQAILDLADLDDVLREASLETQRHVYNVLNLHARISTLTAAETMERNTGVQVEGTGPILLPLRGQGGVLLTDGLAIAITGGLSSDTASLLATPSERFTAASVSTSWASGGCCR